MTTERAEKIATLADRGAVSVRGPDAEKLLAGLITNSIDGLGDRTAVHAGLLSPQGKILFDFFIAKVPDGYVLEVARDQIAGLIKRLTMYKLRADAVIEDASEQYVLLALWGPYACSSGETIGTVAYLDPRHPAMGWRILAEARFATDISSATNGSKSSPEAYHTHRIALGVPEGGKDYDFGDAYPHEANFDLLHGVSFTKGCYVGQEIVARMQHKTSIRKRVVPVQGTASLPSDRPDIRAGEAVIGRLGSVTDARGLAMIRLDRAADFTAQGVALTAGGISLGIDSAILATVMGSATADGPVT
jgi:tRNA-modifying protein YgfZ